MGRYAFGGTDAQPPDNSPETPRGAGTGSGAPVLPKARVVSREPPRYGLASRTTGVAPLYVFFDVTQDDHVLKPPDVDGHLDYADIRYEWDFGDAKSGTWTTSARNKNRATGYLAAHVYDQPGSYQVSLAATDLSGHTEKYSVPIMVQDPNQTFAGESTICASTRRSTDAFAGCPAGARRVTTGNLADVAQHFGDGRRILLRRGDRWSYSESLRVSTNGPMTIGAYGTCDNPSRLGICANAPVLEAAGARSSGGIFELNQARDVRFMDLSFEGPLDHEAAIGGVTEMHQILFYRLQARGFDTPIGNSHWDTEDFDQLAVVQCDIAETSGAPVFLGGIRMGVLGNDLRDSFETHILRLWQAHRAVIQHNELSGTSLNTDTGRHALKLHGPSDQVLNTSDGTHLDFPTQHVIISNNVFGSSGPWPVSIGPQDSATLERLQDIIFEKNRVLPTFGHQSSQPVQIGLQMWARYVTVRNNVFSAAGTGDNFEAVGLDRYTDSYEGLGLPAPEGIRVFNNTVYGASDTGEHHVTLVTLGVAEGTQIANNLIEASPDSTTIARGNAPGTEVGTNLTVVDAGFVDTSSSDPLLWNFSLTETSPAVNGGDQVPVYEDFDGLARPQGAGFSFGAFGR